MASPRRHNGGICLDLFSDLLSLDFDGLYVEGLTRRATQSDMARFEIELKPLCR